MFNSDLVVFVSNLTGYKLFLSSMVLLLKENECPQSLGIRDGPIGVYEPAIDTFSKNRRKRN